ncbi:peroxisomal membrane protein PEX14-like [Diadema antillarum]|uniref:peroxisomal membrane protein PEX14-like n=1 Tax=Diadema antillarum TaxID=105358 RepID=UPI003A845B66
MSAESQGEGAADTTAAGTTAAAVADGAAGGVETVETVAEVPREKMIETAIKFLLNPQVRSSPLVQKQAFLRKKGLREKEIEIAVERSGTRQDVPKPATQQTQQTPQQTQVPMAMHPGVPPQQQHQMMPYMQPPPPSRVSTWRDYMAIAVIISGVSFGLYKLIMKFITPWLKSRKEEKERMERIEESIKELNKNVADTVASLERSVGAIQALLEKQDTQVQAINAEVLSSKALANSRRSTDTTEIKAEIASLKGLLLNRHQFPATPQRSQIPAWQRGGAESSTKGGSSPPSSSGGESTNRRSPSSSPPPTEEPVTNGEPSAVLTAAAPVKEPIREVIAESESQETSSAAAHDNATESQATPTVNGAS